MFDDLDKPDNNKGDKTQTNSQKKEEDNKIDQDKAKPTSDPKTLENIPKEADLGSKKDLEDIFSETENQQSADNSLLPDETGAEKPAVFQPKEANAKEALSADKSQPSSKARKLIIPLVLAVGIAVLGAGGMWGYRYIMQMIGPSDVATEGAEKKKEDLAVPEKKTEEPIKADVADKAVEPIIDEVKNEPIIPLPTEGTDRDKDGLLDSEEITLGTDINNVDTDGDGLFDREEVKVYGTNPLVTDTDGDGFLDGAEVSAGYNPNGSGRLYEIK